MKLVGKKPLVGAVVVSGLVAAGVLAVGHSSPRGAAADATTTAVVRGDLEVSVLASGSMEAERIVNVGTQATGEIKTLNVILGQRVKKGELIAIIDSEQQANDLRRTSASLRSALADLGARKASLHQSTLAAARQRELVAANISGTSDLELAESTLDNAQAAVTVAESAVEQAKVAVASAQIALSYTRVVAPMDGTVVAVVTEQGQTVNSAQTSPTIIKLAQLDRMKIKAQISEADIARIRPKMAAKFSLLGDPDREFPATVDAIEPGPSSLVSEGALGVTAYTRSPAAVYYNCILWVPNADGRLRIGMTAQTVIAIERKHDAMLIPSVALRERTGDGRYEVLVMSTHAGGTAAPEVQRKPVRIGLNNGIQAEVLEGLQPGERVVTSQAKDAADKASAAASK